MAEHFEAAKSNAFTSLLSKEQKIQQEIVESEPPELPSAATYAWTYFLRLHQTRQPTGFGGFCAITYQEMLAFFTLEQSEPEAYELELIRVWDKIALDHLSKQAEELQKKSK